MTIATQDVFQLDNDAVIAWFRQNQSKAAMAALRPISAQPPPISPKSLFILQCALAEGTQEIPQSLKERLLKNMIKTVVRSDSGEQIVGAWGSIGVLLDEQTSPGLVSLANLAAQSVRNRDYPGIEDEIEIISEITQPQVVHLVDALLTQQKRRALGSEPTPRAARLNPKKGPAKKKAAKQKAAQSKATTKKKGKQGTAKKAAGKTKIAAKKKIAARKAKKKAAKKKTTRR